MVSLEQLRALQTISKQQTVILEKEGHFIPLTASWIFNQTLTTFLDGHTNFRPINAAD